MVIGSQFTNSANVGLVINYGRKLMYVFADIARTPSAHRYDTVCLLIALLRPMYIVLYKLRRIFNCINISKIGYLNIK